MVTIEIVDPDLKVNGYKLEETIYILVMTSILIFFFVASLDRKSFIVDIVETLSDLNSASFLLQTLQMLFARCPIQNILPIRATQNSIEKT